MANKIIDMWKTLWKNRRYRFAVIGVAAVAVCALTLIGVNNLMNAALLPPDDAGKGLQQGQGSEPPGHEPAVPPAQEPLPPPPEPPEPEPPEPEPLFSADELAKLSERVDGSTATIPLTEAIYGFFGQSGSAPDHSTTPFAYESLIAREASLIFVTYPSTEEFWRAEEEGITLEIIPVTKDALVFLVNIDNPVDSISREQLRDIYTGKITNWSEVGGLDESIIPFQRTPNSGSQTLMLKLLMDGQEPMEPPEEYIHEQMGDLVNAVSAYDNSRPALGYSMFYYVNNMYGNNRFKLLAVDGVEPVRDTISMDEYPMGTGYYAVMRENEQAGSVARRLVDWLLTDEGQAVAVKAGYIPIRPIEGVLPDTEVDPVYLGDYKNSSGDGGTAWKGWDARGELEANGVKKPLSSVFYDGFNYIDYINTHIADKLQALDLYHTRYMNSDTFDVVLKRAFPGIPRDYPHYSFSERGVELRIEFPAGNPYFRGVRDFGIRLSRDVSPYGEGYETIVSYRKAGQLVPGVNLAMPAVSMPGAPAVADSINSGLQSWVNGFGSDWGKIQQIEWRYREAYRQAEGWELEHFNFILEPFIGYWENYISIAYSLDSNHGTVNEGPLMFSVCFDLDTGERVNIVEKLPDNIGFSKASWVRTPLRQTEDGQTGGDSLPEGFVPAPGSVVTNAIMWGDTMIIYISEPDGRVLEYCFWPGTFE